AGAFFLQQSAEKALKALLIKRMKELMKTHDLVVLARKLNAPEETIEHCKKLTVVYLETRYPDTNIAKEIKEEIENLKDSAKEILKWTKKNL
ncbi:HEPN domain-containing protein, partial [Candidatus Pacearchaeota archaeon]|nr:HEPN domain-containing protein [Candidatus Pacearchaeota archaeon]